MDAKDTNMGEARHASPQESGLAYTSFNSDAESTILLIHGAFTTRSDWSMVIPLLDDYHVLVPDLPGHGESQASIPFSVSSAALLLNQLIIDSAHNKTAHVVGHSLGAHVAICLACTYPEVVSRVMVSGFEVFPTTRFPSYVPYAAWTMQRIENCVPRSLIRWLMDGTDVRNIDTTFCTLALCQQVCSTMLDTERWPSPWPHPTLIIAAGKAGILPTSDHPHDAIKLASIGKQMNNDTRAVSHPQMRHPWNRQAPSLFAAVIKSWLEDGQVPNEFVAL